MKNSVLRNKLGIRFISVATAMMLTAGSLTGCGMTSEKNITEISNEVASVTEDEDSNSLQTIMEQQAGLSHTTSGNPAKEEVVYVLADANGNTNRIIVSDWLKNTNGEKTITDTSALSDISNVSGDESFTQDDEGNITWDAEGNDIHYQGTSTAELPISVNITYKLDGKDITPEELAGKSGKVTVRFDYTNNEKKTVEIGGKEKEIYVPFTMMSGAILDNEHFNNIEVTNGRVISTGSENIVVGMAFPGLADSLRIDELKEKLEDNVDADALDEAQIPDYVEITADTVDFQMNQTMTMAMSDVLSSLNLDKDLSIDTSNVTDSMDELSDASIQLADGTSDLNDGAGKLADGAKTLSEKSVELDDGAKKLKDGASQLNDGTSQLNDGAVKLKDGASQLADGAATLSDGAAQLDNGAASLKDGAGKLDSGVGELSNGIGKVNTGVESLKKGAGELDTGAASLKDGADKLAAGTESLKEQAPLLDDGAAKLQAGYAQLSPGISKIATGSDSWFSAAQDAYNTLFSTQVAAGYTWKNVYDAYEASMRTPEAIGSINEEAIEEINELAASMEGDMSDYASMMDNYQMQMNELALAIESDRTAINDILANPTVNEVQAVTGSEEVEGSYDYSYVTTVNKNITNVTNNTTVVSGEEGAEPETTSETETYEETEEVEGEGTGTYTYTSYNTENISYESYDVSALYSAIDKYASDYQSYADAYAGYMAYSKLVESLGEQADAVEELGATITNIGSGNVNQAMTELACVCAALYEISNSSTAMAQGNAALTQGLIDLKNGTAQAVTGAKQLDDGAKQLAAGAGNLKAGTSQLASGASTLKDGTSQLAAGAANLKDGSSKLASGASTLKDGTATLSNGASTLKDGAVSLKDGTVTLQDGTSSLQDGTLTLYNGTTDLCDGTSQFVDGTKELYDGTLTLNDGTRELMEGMFKFKDEGIDKLTELFGTDVDDVIDTLKAVMDAGSEYSSFSGANSEVESTVKFIYKTDAVK